MTTINKSRAYMITGVFLSTTWASANAFAINLLYDSRWVITQSSLGGGATEQPDWDKQFSDWSVPHQTSSVSDTRFSGSGDGFVRVHEICPYPDTCSVSIDSRFQVQFSVTEPTNISLRGTLSGENIGDGLGEAFVSLTASTNTYPQPIFFRFDNDGSESNNFSVDDLLLPGAYNFEVSTSLAGPVSLSANGTTAQWSFEADFTPVPIPAAIWLFTSGLICLASKTLRSKAF